MSRQLMQLIYIWLGYILSSALFMGCAVEVGNPHPDQDKEKKASIDVSILGEGGINFDSMNLNLVGFSLFSQDKPENSVIFSVRQSIVLEKTDLNKPKSILKGTTTTYGDYDTIRLNFSRQGIGEISVDSQSFPIQTESGNRYVDIPLKFKLKPGNKTKITLGFRDNLLQEFRDTNGQIVSYTFRPDFAPNVAEEELADDSEEDSKSTLSSSYRLTILEINDNDRQVQVRRLRLKIANEWQVNDISRREGTIGNYSVTIEESSADGIKYGWRALTGGTWESDKRTFNADGTVIRPEGEYIQFNFAQPVAIEGIEFEGDDKEKCASLYQMERLNAKGLWEVVPGSVGEMIACSRVNISW